MRRLGDTFVHKLGVCHVWATYCILQIAISCVGIVACASKLLLTDSGHALLMHFGADRPGNGCRHFDDVFCPT